MLGSIATSVRIAANVKEHLQRCRSAQTETGAPPAYEEVRYLLQYLQNHGLSPVLVGSSAIAAHMARDPDPQEFRVTSDLAIAIGGKLPDPPEGWKWDMNAPGIPSWISPSGGTVDFLRRGDQIPDGPRIPKDIEQDTESNTVPIAAVKSIFKMKLDSYREKDLMDLVALARKTGIPELTGLNRQQRENLDYINLIVNHSK